MLRRATARRAERAAALEARMRPLLDQIATTRTELDALKDLGAPIDDLRDAHRRMREAYLAADEVLRAATREAKAEGTRREWSALRTRLSVLSAARQLHLMQERDDVSVLPLGSVRAVDTGMAGPAIGHLQHGRGKQPGAAATYGVDLEAELRAPQAARVVPASEVPDREERLVSAVPTFSTPAAPAATTGGGAPEPEPELEMAAHSGIAPSC